MDNLSLASFSLSRTGDSVPKARGRVRDLATNGIVDLDEETLSDLASVTSELVTNAVAHGAGEMVTIDMDVVPGPRRIRVKVHDESTALPARRVAGPEDESGRGMAVVASLSVARGVEPHERGKWVWVELALPEQLVTGRTATTSPLLDGAECRVPRGPEGTRAALPRPRAWPPGWVVSLRRWLEAYRG
ncbi:ATP-binding protein [Streptomyces sp. NPDC091377]|uniref:ATP-binding protein n=1 Tax=Streptomyces sp. NPDC091377 TaxID=3365995 RepID=UPI0037F666F7